MVPIPFDAAYGSRIVARYARLSGTTEWASPSPEIRNAALFGGFDAFLEIFGGAEPRLLGEFVIGAGHDAVGEASAHGGAGRDQAGRRTFGDLLGKLHGL